MRFLSLHISDNQCDVLGSYDEQERCNLLDPTWFLLLAYFLLVWLQFPPQGTKVADAYHICGDALKKLKHCLELFVPMLFTVLHQWRWCEVCTGEWCLREDRTAIFFAILFLHETLEIYMSVLRDLRAYFSTRVWGRRLSFRKEGFLFYPGSFSTIYI